MVQWDGRSILHGGPTKLHDWYNKDHCLWYVWDALWEGAYKRRKEMVYLMTHSTHFIYGYRKEGNVLFNDALNTFYLRLYGKGPLR